MKTIKAAVTFVVLALFSSNNFAAQKMGIVTVSGASTLSSLEMQIEAKAKKAGASSYKIIEASGNNLLHGTAILYK